ncbi:hypothetical protein AB1L88_15795 [Tautonia sp. JC769]|uniref:hypothetical protein n=1 Tax=Tautonia sp. JC769 TaxID=3232135 RepID=UPI0034581E9B
MMNFSDVEILAQVHRDHPRRVTLFTVALALVRYRTQRELPVSPAELAKLTGQDYTYAKRSLREARQYLNGAPQIPQTGHLEYPKGGTSNTPMGHLEYPIGGTSNTPDGAPGVPQGGHLKCPPLYKEEEEELRACSSRPHAREEPVPESNPEPDPGRPPTDPFAVPPKAFEAPEPAEHRKLRHLADDLSGGNLGRWASDMLKLDYPAHHVRAVIEKKIAGARPMPSPSLLTSILQRWARGEGSDIPPDPATVAKRNAPVEYFKPERKRTSIPRIFGDE